MRGLLGLVLVAALAACGQASAPEAPAEDEPTAIEAPAPPALSTGALGAVSNTAMSITGALTVTPTGLSFEKGFAQETEYLGVVDATTDISANGESFAEAAPGPVSLRIELRRFVGGAPVQLCGAETPATYVALASDEPLTALTLIVFSGADVPGPTARDSAVCATFAYAVD